MTSFNLRTITNNYANFSFPDLYCFLGFLKKNEFILKEEIARKRPDLIECITWNPHAKAQNGVIGRVYYFLFFHTHTSIILRAFYDKLQTFK